jgi:hypothetical protein
MNVPKFHLLPSHISECLFDVCSFALTFTSHASVITQYHTLWFAANPGQTVYSRVRIKRSASVKEPLRPAQTPSFAATLHFVTYLRWRHPLRAPLHPHPHRSYIDRNDSMASNKYVRSAKPSTRIQLTTLGASHWRASRLPSITASRPPRCWFVPPPSTLLWRLSCTSE